MVYMIAAFVGVVCFWTPVMMKNASAVAKTPVKRIDATSPKFHFSGKTAGSKNKDDTKDRISTQTICMVVKR